MSDSENQVQTMDDLLKISNLICYDDNVKAGVGTLTFEVCSKMKFIRVDTIKGEIKSWLLGNFLVLKLGTQVDISVGELPNASHMRSITLSSFDRPSETELLILQYHHIEIHVYCLAADDDFYIPDEVPQLSVWPMPHSTLDGQWEALFFPNDLQKTLLRMIIQSIKLLRTYNALAGIHHLILLHGPPGVGKTTLAQALGQKLSIRLDNHFPNTSFVELSANGLLSRWFGESGKGVRKAFDEIERMASDETCLTVVMIDEVETIASSREHLGHNDVGDALRATNELLQGLDRVRKLPNVVVICTTNLFKSLDSAFLDRCSMVQEVTDLNEGCIFNLLAQEINKLLSAGVISSTTNSPGLVFWEPALRSALAAFPPTQNEDSEPVTQFPKFSDIPAAKLNSCYEYKWLRRIAIFCGWFGVSGRVLRQLPVLALTRHCVHSPARLNDVILAMKYEVVSKVCDVGYDAVLDGFDEVFEE